MSCMLVDFEHSILHVNLTEQIMILQNLHFLSRAGEVHKDPEATTKLHACIILLLEPGRYQVMAWNGAFNGHLSVHLPHKGKNMQPRYSSGIVPPYAATEAPF